VSDQPLLEVRDVCASYEGVEALHRVSLSVARGTVTAILGANGVGKSTLLAVIAGILTATEGEVRFDGEVVTGRGAASLARKGLCLVPEGRGIFPNLTVRENLWVMTHTGVDRRELEGQSFERFAILFSRRNQAAGNLSGGEQQMLAMARALATRPKLLLLDELSMGLGPMVVQELYQHVSRLAEDGVTVIVVEQFARTALSVATSGIVMAGGRVVHSGPPDEIESVLHSAYLGSKPPTAEPRTASTQLQPGMNLNRRPGTEQANGKRSRRV
jgi:branched-chain amino acid transport system ATP-binding protein